jgi:hypothetical protein
MTTRLRVVEKGNSNDSVSQDALVGVNGLASQTAGHKGSQGILDEEKASGDEDEPDD